ncbi:cytochrome P450 [Hamadaea tsunoensis]|uniref:cytochrome P450 n=1 Tax=Hamadaea tsunoensis TaxID=53368 RepID=UPI000428B0C0|nr:cytochrome P450 [Hamadaea tsunoensis]
MTQPAIASVPRIVVHDPEVHRDPIGVYGRLREESPLVRVLALGLPAKWALTRFADVRSMFADPRFAFTADSAVTPDVPPEGGAQIQATLVDHEGHKRLRSGMARTFTPQRAAEFRPRIESIVDALLDELPDRAEGGAVDLLRHFADPLPIDATAAFLGIPEADHVQWRGFPEPVGSGVPGRFAEVMPAILDRSRAAIAYRQAHPGEDVLSLLLAGDPKPAAADLEGFVWINIMASSTVSGLLASAFLALLTHPDQCAALRSGEAGAATAIDELVRWCGLHVLSTPRYAVADVEVHGVVIPRGSAVVGCIAAANRDPRVFAEPDRLWLARPLRAGSPPHLGFAHGPHGCAGNALGRVIIDVALTRVLQRFPELALAADPADLTYVDDPEAHRLAALPVTL